MGFSLCLCWENVWIGGQVDISFQICGGQGQGGFREIVHYANELALLKTNLVELGVDRYCQVRVQDHTSELVPFMHFKTT